MWKFPWKFRESFTIAFGLLFIGLLLEFFTHPLIIQPIKYPVNVYGGVIFIVVLSLFQFIFRKDNFIKWLSSVPAAISAITLFAFLTLIMGFIPQSDLHDSIFTKLGLTHMTQSWEFLFIVVYLEFILGLTIVRRIQKFSLSDTSFVLNHMGLWLIIFSIGFGSGDLKRWNMSIREGETVWYAFDSKNKRHELNFAFKLKDFRMEQYQPKIGVISADGYHIPEKYKDQMFRSGRDVEAQIGNWKIMIDTFYRFSVKDDNRYYRNRKEGATYSAFVTVKNTNKNKVEKGWISCGSYSMRPKALRLNKKFMITMAAPEPKKYSSDMMLYVKEGIKKEVSLEVNKPLKVSGWKIYQAGYNQRKGRWSETTKLEIVRDPWLPVVYSGIFMLLGGALMLFWSGRRKQTKKRK